MDETLIDSEEPGPFLQASLMQSTQQVLMTTGDNNQLIGILEEDSEDFDDEDEDDDEDIDDDMDPNKGEFFH